MVLGVLIFAILEFNILKGFYQLLKKFLFLQGSAVLNLELGEQFIVFLIGEFDQLKEEF